MFQISDVYSEVNDLNFKEICRLCRTAKGVMSYIYGSAGLDISIPLSVRIMKFANIKMSEGDGLPSLICHRCLYHIEKACEFKEQCEQSDALLRRFIEMEHSSKVVIKANDLPRSSLGVQCEAVTQELNQNNKCKNTEEEKNTEPCTEDDVDLESLMTNVDHSQAADESDDHSEVESNDLTCPSCNKKFEASEALGRHLNIHTQEGPFPCDYCEAIAPDKATLKSHWRMCHSDDKPYVCLTCGEAFSQRESLTEHNIMHNKVKPFHCTEPRCNKAFAYRSDLRKHSVIHTGIRPYVCPICYKSFTRSTNLNKHARLHTGSKPFSCDNCNKMFASRGDLVRHAVIHTGEKPYSCAVCSLSFNRKDKLSRHEKLHKGERAHACSECPTSFHRKEELTKHIQFHHYSPVMYEEDGLSDSKEGPIHSLNGSNILQETLMHCETVTVKEEVDEAEAEDLVVSVDPLIWEDTKTHCDICNKPFTDINELHKHKMSHSKPRDFVCSVCSKGFHQRRELVRHSIIHTGHKPHACLTCGKAFSRRDKLTRHMRIHRIELLMGKQNQQTPESSELARTCEICNRVYSSKHELSRHLLTHSETRPYQCELCSSSYVRKDKLAKHILNSHPEIVKPMS